MRKTRKDKGHKRRNYLMAGGFGLLALGLGASMIKRKPPAIGVGSSPRQIGVGKTARPLAKEEAKDVNEIIAYQNSNGATGLSPRLQERLKTYNPPQVKPDIRDNGNWIA
jgi:hypothetical protein